MYQRNLLRLITFVVLAAGADAAAYCVAGVPGALLMLAGSQAELFARWARGR